MVTTTTPPSSPPATHGTVGPWTFAPTGLQNPGRYFWDPSLAHAFNQYHDNDVLGRGLVNPSGALPAESLWSGLTPAAKQNPPFLSMASGQLMDNFPSVGGPPTRLLRGFIRRTYSDSNDPNSGCRLNFMFNPPEIQRDYVSYLDQGALDPFNTIYQSGNLVAPPSILNFSFELFFDRQAEAMDPTNPGTFVDQEFFDKVVRGVRDENVGPNPAGIPDNGLILSGAQDVTVVFSPQLAVSGRPINASVSYVKFTHRMVPTRMVIGITIRAVRIGPVTQDVQPYSSSASGASNAEGFAAASRVATPEQESPVITFTRVALAFAADDPDLDTYVVNTTAFVTGASGQGNGSAVDYVKAQVAKFGTGYDAQNRMNLWKSCDCSSLVWAAFAGTNQSSQLGWPTWDGVAAPVKIHAPSSYSMWLGLKDSNAAQKVWGFSGTPAASEGIAKMQKGDLVFRIVGDGSVEGENHVAIVESVSGDTATIFEAKSPSKGVGSAVLSSGNNGSRFNYCIRPLTRGGDANVNANNTHNNETNNTGIL